MTSIREPVVAGAFYPGSPAALSAELKRLFGSSVDVSEREITSPVGLIAPHAGYAYSGPTAAVGYRQLATLGQPKWAIVLGANHTGLGRPVSLARVGIWRTPLGDAPIATELADRLVATGLEVSAAAFLREHSIEVQLPERGRLLSQPGRGAALHLRGWGDHYFDDYCEKARLGRHSTLVLCHLWRCHRGSPFGRRVRSDLLFGEGTWLEA